MTISRDYQILAGLTLVFAILPLFANQFQLTLLITLLYWAYLGTAWNIMGGYAGQFSFGHSAFFGIGAYTSTVLFLNYGISPWLGMFVGAGFAALFGAAMGFLTFRFGVKGHFFALATFAFAEMSRLIAQDSDFINSTIGLTMPIIGGDSWSQMIFEDTKLYYYIVILGMLIVATMISIWIYRNKLGYYLLAIREDEDAAAALGVDTLRYKIIAVAISAAITAIGGSFFAQRFGFIDPALVFGVSISIAVLLRPIFGGSGAIWGPLVGAIFLTPMEEFTKIFVRNPPEFLSFMKGRAGFDVLLFGVIIIIVVIYMPDGLVGSIPQWLERLRRRLRGQSQSATQEAAR
ncbi:MAG: branched-chain amino acid ABC transporter permease [Anaerolineae bacterium]|nr:branched-chain amino acid ABC transporter permease [Anaerolineae bacterium]